MQNELTDLFFSNPIRNAASANAARRLPWPASFPVTAYSLTKACEQTRGKATFRNNKSFNCHNLQKDSITKNLPPSYLGTSSP